MDDVLIRAATPEDEAALGRYGGALMRQHHDLDPERFIRSDNPEAGYGHFLVSQLAERECVVLVAERSREIVGYAYASLEPMSWKDLRASCGYLHDVFVDPRTRGEGIGGRIALAAIGWLEAHGAPRVVLMSAARNEDAQRLFARLGFRRTMVEMTREAGSSGADR